MRPLGWALIQYVWCPYKKRKFGHRITEGRSNEDTGRRQLSKQRGLRRNQPCGHLDLRLLAFRTVRNICCLSHSVCGTVLWQPQQTNTKYLHIYAHTYINTYTHIIYTHTHTYICMHVCMFARVFSPTKQFSNSLQTMTACPTIYFNSNTIHLVPQDCPSNANCKSKSSALLTHWL